MKQFQEPVVPDLKTILLVEHAQAMRHVVERDIEAVCLFLEARCERGFFARHRQGLNDDVANAERDVDHAVDEHQNNDAQGPVYPVGVDEQRNGHR